MEQKTDNRKPSFSTGNILLFVAGILFCLVLISTAMLGSLFARYTTGSSGSDSARVVKFGDLTMTETGDFVGDAQKTAIVTPGVDLNKKVVVKFDASEVATIVFVQVTAPNWKVSDNGKQFNLNGKLSWTVADGWEYLAGSNYVYYKELAPNTKLEADVIAEIEKDSGTQIKVESTITEADIEDLLENLQLVFQASVIQNDGSLTPETAWDRLD